MSDKTVSKRFRKDKILVSTIMALGLILTVGLIFETSREIERQERATFADEKKHIQDSIADQLRAASESVHNMAVLFTVSATEVDSDAFRMIAETALAQQRAIQFISFARWVPDAAKKSFEEQNWRASGVAQFQIHSDGVQISGQPFYLPIVYLEPLTPTSISYLGYDLWSQEKFRSDIQSAINTGETMLSDAIFNPTLDGFALVKAVYTGKMFPLSEEERQKSVLGILRVVVGSNELMAGLHNYDKFNLLLTSKNSTVVAKKVQSWESHNFLDMKLTDSAPIKISNISFNLTVEKYVPFTWARAGIYLMVLLLGTTISVLIAYRLSMFMRAQREILDRQAEIEAKVEEKTKALQQSEFLLRQVINSNPNVIFAQGSDQRILFANQTFFDTFKTTEEDVYHKIASIPLPGQKFEKGSWEEEVELAGGGRLWFETHRVDIELEAHGRCWLVVAVDISQRKLANAVIADQRAKMVTSAKLSALGEMAGGIAHEINTPLTTLQLSSDFICEILKEGNPDLKSVEEQAWLIAKTTDRIGKIVTGLRSFSKDGSRDQMSVFGLVKTIENTLVLCREKFRNSAIHLDWQPHKELYVFGREVQISQVILNLLNNSFDAVQEVPGAWVRIRLSEVNENAEISVEDNGYGVSEDARERLFHPFFTTKESGKGTGLGLSISKGIVENHSGVLRLDQDIIHTRFVMTLPKVQPTISEQQQGSLL